MIKKPLWVSEELQKKILICKSLIGVVNVEEVLKRLGVVEQLNQLITDSLKKQTESTKTLLKNGRKS